MDNINGSYSNREMSIFFKVLCDTVLWEIPKEILYDNNLVGIFGYGFEETNRHALLNSFTQHWNEQIKLYKFDFEMFHYLTQLIRHRTYSILRVLAIEGRISLPDHLLQYENSLL